jgi:hypothetical protein
MEGWKHMIRETLTALAGLALLLAACGGGSPEEASGGDPAAPEGGELRADRRITVVDSIGVELGDSNYVFGQPVGADFTADGDIAVLDMQLAEVRIFDEEGNFAASFGRQGSGPGEFQLASALDVAPDGGFVVADGMGRKLLFFGPDGEFRDAMEGFFPAPPVMLEALDSAIVGIQPAFEQTDEGVFSGMALSRWEGDDIEPVVTYHRDLKPFDPQSMMTGMMEDMMLFAVASDGRVYRSSIGTDTFILVGYEPGGDEFLHVEEEVAPVPKTPEEIEEERELMRSRFIQGGAPPEIAESYEPQPNRPVVANLFTDGEDRIWAQMGTVENPTFRVFDPEGEEQFVAAVDYEGDASGWQIAAAQDGRFLAFDVNPDLYPRIYVLQIEQ